MPPKTASRVPVGQAQSLAATREGKSCFPLAAWRSRRRAGPGVGTQGVQLTIRDRTLRRVSCSGTAGSIAAASSSGSMNGRISTSESSIIGFGHFFTQSIASCSEETFQIQNPATSSVVSANGPSVTVRFEPENRTRAPRELGASPPPIVHDSRIDQFFVELAHGREHFGGGISPASDAFDALTITMTFMTELLNLVDGDAIEVDHFPTFTSSQTRNSPIDNNLQNCATNRLPTHFVQEIAG